VVHVVRFAREIRDGELKLMGTEAAVLIAWNEAEART
jgi:hypothetical protein